MAPLSKIALLAILGALASSAYAAPAAVGKRPSVRKEITPVVPSVPTTVLSNVADTVKPVAVISNNFVSGPVNQLQSALDFVSEQLNNFAFTEHIVKDSYVTKHNGVMHVYLRQMVNGLEVVNGDINVNVMPDGSILSSGSSFFAGKEAPAVDGETFAPKLSAMDAMASFSKFLGEDLNPRSKSFFSASVGAEEVKLDENSALIRNVPFAESDVKARRVYIQTEDKTLRLGWELTVEMENNWFYTVVDELDGSVLNVNDWVSQAVPTYRVLPFGVEDPSFGDRELVTKTANTVSSPLGWHDTGSTKYTDTRGNNVDAYSRSSSTNRRPDGGANLLFDNPADFVKGSPKDYYEAATTQLFHTINRYHDLLYNLGFDEVSGNFQTNNFGKGGKGNDAVLASAQEPSGTNNANFATPADGSPGKMNMFIWTRTTPQRDGDFQQGIVIHEYSHGLSTRLTGGPANSNCLPSGEAGGMGEGWGDAMGSVLLQKPEYTRNTKITMGAYVFGNAIGVRKYPYSSDTSVDPETYGYLKKSGYSEVHVIGEVWAGILHEVYWELREAKGHDADLFNVDVSTAAARNKVKGDVTFLLNVVDGMKGQPCKPTFLSARDAILAADAANFGGANVCTMWKGFAKRGLGFSAKASGAEAFDLPANCK